MPTPSPARLRYPPLHRSLMTPTPPAQIMESLGGDRAWFDRFIAEHAAVFYYWVLIAFYLVSPRMAYNFMQRVELHAADTYCEQRPLGLCRLIESRNGGPSLCMPVAGAEAWSVPASQRRCAMTCSQLLPAQARFAPPSVHACSLPCPAPCRRRRAPAAAFVERNRTALADIPPPLVALQYYYSDDLYLFDEWVRAEERSASVGVRAGGRSSALVVGGVRVGGARRCAPIANRVVSQTTRAHSPPTSTLPACARRFQTASRGAPGVPPRRPPCENLLDVFTNIRDDELEHVKTMVACQVCILEGGRKRLHLSNQVCGRGWGGHSAGCSLGTDSGSGV